MPLEFEDGLAGVRMWCLKVQGNAFVHALAASVAERAKNDFSGFRQSPDHLAGDLRHCRAGHADDADSAPSGRGGNGGDGVSGYLTVWHGQVCRG